MLDRIRMLGLVGAVLLAGACGTNDSSLLRGVSGEWTGEGTRGGMRIQLDRGGGALVGIAPDGTVIDTMSVDLVGISGDAGTVRLRRAETGGEFTIERLQPGSDDRSRIRLVFPNGRQVQLVYSGPLPPGDGG